MPEKENSEKAPDPTPPQTDTPSPPPLDPRMLAAMYGQMYEEDTIDLLEYWRTIWGRRRMIVASSFLVALFAAGISLRMPNIYRAELLMAPVTNKENKTGGLSSTLGGLGGLATLAGISMPSGGDAEENLAVLKSRRFIWGFIKDNNLVPILFEDAWDAERKRWKGRDPKEQPSLWDAYRKFTNAMLQVNRDRQTQLISITMEWKDAQLAARWANELIQRLNDYLREQAINHSRDNLAYLHKELAKTRVSELRQTLFELIASEERKAMLANTQEEFSFRILDPATPPDKKAKPKRSIIVIFSTLIAGFMAALYALIREGIERRKQES